MILPFEEQKPEHEDTSASELRLQYGLDRCKVRPYTHQVLGIHELVQKPFFLLADEMGAGKTLQVIVAAQILFDAGVIDNVCVISPAAVRSVWYDPDLGELQKHLWDEIPAKIMEFHAKLRVWQTEAVTDDPKQRIMRWTITNYDFITARVRLYQLMPFCNRRTLLIMDESSAVKNSKAKRTKACMVIRKTCARVVLMNGTPIANHPGDLFSQGNLMSPKILDCPSYTQFCVRYADMKVILGPGGRPVLSPKTGKPLMQPAGWRGVEQLQELFGPYVLRRLKVDCIDLPPKLPPVIWTVPLTPTTWAAYKAMRDDFVTWITNGSVSMAPQIITKVMRLAQITSGFIGGVVEMNLEDGGEVMALQALDPDAPPLPTTVQEIGREKLDLWFERVESIMEEDENLKLITWSRFVPELQRAVRETKERWPDIPVGVVAGGQLAEDRDFALRLLDPTTAPRGPAFVFGNPQSGGLGLNMTAAHTMIRMSNDYSLFKRLQSDDRIHRPGQTSPTSYADIIATGPKGQKTVDHTIIAALIAKESLANLTTSAWVDALMEE